MFLNLFDFQKSMKNSDDIEKKIKIIIESFKTKTKIEYDDKNTYLCILKKEDAMLDSETTVYIHQKCQCGKIGNILKKYSKAGNIINEITNQIKSLKNFEKVTTRRACY